MWALLKGTTACVILTVASSCALQFHYIGTAPPLELLILTGIIGLISAGVMAVKRNHKFFSAIMCGAGSAAIVTAILTVLCFPPITETFVMAFILAMKMFIPGAFGGLGYKLAAG